MGDEIGVNRARPEQLRLKILSWAMLAGAILMAVGGFALVTFVPELDDVREIIIGVFLLAALIDLGLFFLYRNKARIAAGRLEGRMPTPGGPVDRN